MPAAEVKGLRRRGASPERTRAEPADHAPSATTTAEKAVAYKPDVRVRMTVLRDYISIFRSRYMDSFFGLACAALACQLVLVLWRGLGVVEPELLMLPNGTVVHVEDYVRVAERAMRGVSRAAGDLRVVDACRLAYHELGWLWPLSLLTGLAYLLRRKSAVYLLDFSLFEPPEEWKVSQAELMALLRSIGEARGSYDESDLAFMEKVLGNSGTGDKTAWPPGIVRCADPNARQEESMQAARQEAETIICGALEGLFARTGIQPKEIDFLIINCSLFSPTPSLCAMASNRFRLRSNCRTFNLSGQARGEEAGLAARRAHAQAYGALLAWVSRLSARARGAGTLFTVTVLTPLPPSAVACLTPMASPLASPAQGCSASLLSTDLAAELLQNNPNSIAIVVSTELITQVG